MQSRGWIVTSVVLGVLCVGGAVAGLDALRSTVKGWGHGFIDQPIKSDTPDDWLDAKLSFDLQEVELTHPTSIAKPLNEHVAWWLGKTKPTVVLGRPYADGLRAVWVRYNSTFDGKSVAVSNAAHPVACPDPGKYRRCYHAGIQIEDNELHLAMVLERDPVEHGAVHYRMHANAMLLISGRQPLRALGGPMKGMHGWRFEKVLDTLGRPPTMDPEKRHWALEGHVRSSWKDMATKTPPPGRRDFIRPDYARRTFVDKWSSVWGR